MQLEYDKEHCSKEMIEFLETVNETIERVESVYEIDFDEIRSEIEFIVDSYGDVLFDFYMKDDEEYETEWVFNQFSGNEVRSEDHIPHEQRTKYDIKQLENLSFVEWLESVMVVAEI